MKYLEQKDRNMHARARAMIKECYDRNKQGDPAYASLTLSMQTKLRETVGPVYWKKAEDYLNHFLSQKRKNQEAARAAQGQTPRAPVPASVAAPVAQQHPGASHPPQQTRIPHPSAPAATGIPPPSSSAPVYSKPSVEQQQQQPPPAMPPSQPVAPTTPASLPPGTSQAERAAAAARYATMGSTGTNTGVANNIKPNSAAAIQAAAAAKKEAARVERAKRTAEKRRQQAEKKRAAAAPRVAIVPGSATTHLPGSVPAVTAHPPGSTSLPGTAPPPLAASDATANSAASATAAKKRKAAAEKRKTALKSGSSAADETSATAINANSSKDKDENMEKENQEEIPREYAEFMEMVDHAVKYDHSNAGLLLSPDLFQCDVNIQEEQWKLLYGDIGDATKTQQGQQRPQQPSLQRPVLPVVAAAAAAASSSLPPALRGWGKRNIVSARTAWARVRLPEQQRKQQNDLKNKLPSLPTKSTSSTPQTATSAISSTGVTTTTATDPSSSSSDTTPSSPSTAWVNDEKAEEDITLALLSEATEIYLKTILEGAVSAARSRQNIDGIRLWHQQHVAANSITPAPTVPGAPSTASSNHKQKIPALTLRLGCDVKRQVALAQGNAAKTYQRMEEALSRRKSSSIKNNTSLKDISTRINATSMSDLSLKPSLSENVSSKADYHAKRSFEIYGGKDSGEPPLGRVLKKAKIAAGDFRACMVDPMFPF